MNDTTTRLRPRILAAGLPAHFPLEVAQALPGFRGRVTRARDLRQACVAIDAGVDIVLVGPSMKSWDVEVLRVHARSRGHTTHETNLDHAVHTLRTLIERLPRR